MTPAHRTTMMQLCLAIESYLIAESSRHGIAGISAMTEPQLKEYWAYLSETFNQLS